MSKIKRTDKELATEAAQSALTFLGIKGVRPDLQTRLRDALRTLYSAEWGVISPTALFVLFEEARQAIIPLWNAEEDGHAIEHIVDEACARFCQVQPVPDQSGDDRTKGLYKKWEVRRLGDEAGKHNSCPLLVLDFQHDAFAITAGLAYACAARKAGYHALATDIEDVIKVASPNAPEVADKPAVSLPPSALVALVAAWRVLHAEWHHYNDAVEKVTVALTEAGFTPPTDPIFDTFGFDMRREIDDRLKEWIKPESAPKLEGISPLAWLDLIEAAIKLPSDFLAASKGFEGVGRLRNYLASLQVPTDIRHNIPGAAVYQKGEVIYVIDPSLPFPDGYSEPHGGLQKAREDAAEAVKMSIEERAARFAPTPHSDGYTPIGADGAIELEAIKRLIVVPLKDGAVDVAELQKKQQELRLQLGEVWNVLRDLDASVQDAFRDCNRANRIIGLVIKENNTLRSKANRLDEAFPVIARIGRLADGTLGHYTTEDGLAFFALGLNDSREIKREVAILLQGEESKLEGGLKPEATVHLPGKRMTEKEFLSGEGDVFTTFEPITQLITISALQALHALLLGVWGSGGEPSAQFRKVEQILRMLDQKAGLVDALTFRAEGAERELQEALEYAGELVHTSRKQAEAITVLGGGYKALSGTLALMDTIAQHPGLILTAISPVIEAAVEALASYEGQRLTMPPVKIADAAAQAPSQGLTPEY